MEKLTYLNRPRSIQDGTWKPRVEISIIKPVNDVIIIENLNIKFETEEEAKSYGKQMLFDWIRQMELEEK